MLKNYFLFTLFIIFSSSLNAQVFKGFKAFKYLIEFEGQRYLINDIYEITSADIDKLKIEKTIKEVDNEEGFMFVLTSYIFNGKSGIVISSFNSTNFSNTKYHFVNIHLTHEEFMELNNIFEDLKTNKPEDNEHYLKKFNDRIIVDVHDRLGTLYFTLWVDRNRHTFFTDKWGKTIKKYKKFIR